MAKATLVFAVLLIALGLAGFVFTGSQHPTALIPTWFGLALGLFGILAISPNESRRKLFMHINVTIGLLGFLGAVVEILRSLVSSNAILMAALLAKSAMALLLFIYVILCVRSFIVARRSRKV